MDATATQQPTVVLTIQNGDTIESHIAFTDKGEIVETVDHYHDADGLRQPDWSAAGICDARGAGGKEGFDCLRRALEAGEANARLAGFTVKRVTD